MGYALSPPLAGSGITIPACENFDNPNVVERPSPVGYPVCLVRPICLIQPTKPSRPHKHNGLVEHEERRTRGAMYETG